MRLVLKPMAHAPQAPWRRTLIQNSHRGRFATGRKEENVVQREKRLPCFALALIQFTSINSHPEVGEFPIANIAPYRILDRSATIFATNYDANPPAGPAPARQANLVAAGDDRG
jgi:hypothetical protein